MDIFGKIAFESRFFLKFCPVSKNCFIKSACTTSARHLQDVCYDHGSMMPSMRFP